MSTKDKVLVAFLVSLGLFSAAQARQYVGRLSVRAKQQLHSVQNNASMLQMAELITETSSQNPKTKKYSV